MTRPPSLRSIVIAACLIGAGPAAGQPAPSATKPGAVAAAAARPNDRIRLDFREASVLQVIRLLAELSGANIVASEKAGEAKVSVFLQDVTAEAALDAVCKTAGLWYRKENATGLWRVMTVDEYQRDIVVYRTEQTRTFTLRNANVVAGANAIAALFGGRVKLSAGVEEAAAGVAAGGPAAGQGAALAGGTATGGSAVGGAPARAGNQALTAGQIAATLEKLSGPGDSAAAEREGRFADRVIEPPPVFVTYNRLHNLLIVRTGDLEALAEIERLMATFDRPTRQVLLEMKVLEVTIGDGFRSVFDIGVSGGGSFSGPDVGQSPNPLNPTAASGSRATLGSGNFPLEGGTMVFQLMNDRILARLQLLATENKVNVLATPMLLASNNQPARLFVGEERILTTGITASTVTNQTQTVTTFTAQTEKRDVGNTLQVLPRINADGTVTLTITQDSSSVLPKSSTIPVGANGNIQEFPIDTVNTSNLSVTVIAKDRHVVAVGGMIRERASDAESKVPLLGDIPVLGNLFKRRVKENSRTELVLLVTPYIIETPEDGEAGSREALGGRITHPGTPFGVDKAAGTPN